MISPQKHLSSIAPCKCLCALLEVCSEMMNTNSQLRIASAERMSVTVCSPSRYTRAVTCRPARQQARTAFIQWACTKDPLLAAVLGKSVLGGFTLNNNSRVLLPSSRPGGLIRRLCVRILHLTPTTTLPFIFPSKSNLARRCGVKNLSRRR